MADIQAPLDTIKTGNIDAWQKVIALDASYLRKRATNAPHLNPIRWKTYLRRRYQLSQTSSPQCSADRSEYLIIRGTLLTQKYVIQFLRIIECSILCNFSIAVSFQSKAVSSFCSF